MCQPKSRFMFDPIVPFYFIEENKEEMLHELQRLKNEAGIRRILLVFPIWNSHAKGLYAMNEFEKFGCLLHEIRKKLAVNGIEVGWWCAPTLSLGPRTSVVNNSQYHFQRIVGIDGAVSRTANCPLDKKYQSIYCKYVQLVVENGRPPVIFFEDDYEISNHDVVQYGCFCPLHLKRFSEKIGEKVTREELEEIFRRCDDKAVKYRREWAELMKDSLVELAAELRSAVDVFAPDTRMALCQPFPCDFDGDMTEPVARAFAGNNRPLVRLWGSDYNSDVADNFPALTFHMLYSRQALDESFELIHESDPYPHSRFFFSSNKLRALMVLSMLYGLNGSLLYLTQYTDGPLEEKGYVLMIRESRTYLTELRRSIEGLRIVGPGILYRPFSHVNRKIHGTKAPYHTCPAWASVLGRFGIPYTARFDDKPVMVCGEEILEMSREEILGLLQNGVFLDGLAAYYLCRNGYGELIGVDVKETGSSDNLNIRYERLTEKNLWRENTEGSRIYYIDLSAAIRDHSNVYLLKPEPGCQVLSEFIDESGQAVSPSAVLFTNRLGGRVAVFSYDLQQNTTASIYNYKRKEQFRGVIEWLGGKNLPVYVDGDPNVFVTALENPESGDKIAAVFNMSLDKIKELHLVIDASWKKEKLWSLMDEGEWKLISDAKWREVGKEKFRLTVSKICTTLHPVVFKFCDK